MSFYSIFKQKTNCNCSELPFYRVQYGVVLSLCKSTVKQVSIKFLSMANCDEWGLSMIWSTSGPKIFRLGCWTYHVNNNKGNSIRIESSHRGEVIQSLKYAIKTPTFDSENSLFKGLTALAKSCLLRKIFGYPRRLTNADGLSRFYNFFQDRTTFEGAAYWHV